MFFQTTESLVAADTDSSMDVYERSSGTTTLLSHGTERRQRGVQRDLRGRVSTDGSHVFIRTAEKLVDAGHRQRAGHL